MSLLTLVLVIIVVGVLLYAANRFVPMDGVVKNILNIVVVLILVFWLLKALGIVAWLETIRI